MDSEDKYHYAADFSGQSWRYVTRNAIGYWFLPIYMILSKILGREVGIKK